MIPPRRELIDKLGRKWNLSIGDVLSAGDGPSWVARARGRDGERVVLKIGFPHFEAEGEVAGLHHWNGGGTVRLLQADEDANAMLLEECVPGTSLKEVPESAQDEVICRLLPRLWSAKPSFENKFRPLHSMLDRWAAESRGDDAKWPDAALVEAGLSLFNELSTPAASDVVLFTDLHAGNVLRSNREPWLAIDPKPFVGDPAYDLTQHLFNCMARLRADPERTINNLADRVGVDRRRVRLWTFARAAAEPRRDWGDGIRFDIARGLRP